MNSRDRQRDDYARPSSSRRKGNGLNSILATMAEHGRPKSSHAQPTVAALVKATNKLSLYPEFQDLRRVVAGLQVENLKTVVAEEQSQVVLQSLGRKYTDMQRALGLLVDTVVDEFSAMREQLSERDRRIEELARNNAKLEGQVHDLRKWAEAAHDDLIELRKVMAVEVTEDSLNLRKIAGQHTDLLESMRQQQIKLQQEVVTLSSTAREAVLGLHELKGRIESRVRSNNDGNEIALADLKHRIRSLEDRLKDNAIRTQKVEELFIKSRTGR